MTSSLRTRSSFRSPRWRMSQVIRRMSKDGFTKLYDPDHPRSPPVVSTVVEDEKLAIIEPAKPHLAKKTPIFIFVSCFFIVVSTVLGSGILALPIKIATTGFWPFVVGYSITCIAECLTLVFTVEILERAHMIKWREQEDPDTNTSIRFPATTKVSSGLLPDLHSVGELLLKWAPLRFIFQFCVILHFVSILISYALAGSQAYAQLIGKEHLAGTVVPFFIVLWTALVFAGYKIIPHIISFLTLGKGSLLVMLVLITAYIAWRVDIAPFSNWVYMGRPLLVGTVALGGGMNLLPLVYGRLLSFSRSDMRKLCIAAVSALLIVFLLNVLWCYYILHIVPQVGSGVTLEQAGKNGQISTIPLMEIIKQKYKDLEWLAILIDVFVALSITVSFITVGSGTKHTFDGLAYGYHEHVMRQADETSPGVPQPTMGILARAKFWFDNVCVRRQLGLNGLKLTVNLIVFLLVLIIATANPHSFLIILERGTSLALNLEAGLFVGLMLELSRRMTAGIPIPYVLPRWMYHLRWPMIVFFLFASVYTFVDLIAQQL